MTIVNAIKPLLSSSSLFVAQGDEKARGESGRGIVQRGAAKYNKKARKAALKSLVKIGTGGTLDPLADGVLVLAVGKGTKELQKFLDCVKEYEATCLLGCETDTYDSQGIRVRVAPWSHVTRKSIEEVLDRFRGEISQTPPIFSALKMDGKPLYEYAREGLPLPRSIPPRLVTVHSLELVDWKDGSSHDFKWPENAISAEDREKLRHVVQSVASDSSQLVTSVDDEFDPTMQQGASTSSLNETAPRPSAFVLRMKVSGGTYVRSIAHDIGHALGSAAHVVTLTRVRQGDFTLEPEKESDRACVPWVVIEEGLKQAEEPEENAQRNEEGYMNWEAEVLKNIVIVEE